MKRVNIFLFFLIILASAACISLPGLNLPQIKTQPPVVLLPSITPTAESLPPTSLPETGSPTLMPPPVEPTLESPAEPPDQDQKPTLPPVEVPSPTPLPPTEVPSPTPTPQPFYPVRVDPPSYLPNFTHAEKGCKWIGVGGQIFDLDGQPVQGWTVVVTGTLDGEVRQWLGLSGLNTAFGPAGYEIELGDTPRETSGVFTIQLRDAYGQPLTEVVPFDTHENCQANLAMINFVQSHAISKLYAPVITH